MTLIYLYKNGLGPSHSTDRVVSISARPHMVISQDNKGFSLIELIMVMTIIGILSQMAIIAVPNMKNFIGKTKSQAEIRLIEKDIVAYMVDKGVLPNSLNEIGRADLRDYWGHPYQYLNLTNGPGNSRQDSMMQNYNSDFDLYSLGSDGVSQQDFDDPTSKDDIIRSGDGSYVGSRAF